MLENSVSSVSAEEMRMIVGAMATEFLGTGHWHRCENGHPFTIGKWHRFNCDDEREFDNLLLGECGMPVQLARCPQCNAPVGGQNHQAVAGVTYARDIEERFGNLRT